MFNKTYQAIILTKWISVHLSLLFDSPFQQSQFSSVAKASPPWVAACPGRSEKVKVKEAVELEPYIPPETNSKFIPLKI